MNPSSLFTEPEVAGVKCWELNIELENIVARRRPELTAAQRALVFQHLAGRAAGYYRQHVIAMRAHGFTWERIAVELGVRAKDPDGTAGDEWMAAVQVFNEVGSEDSWGYKIVRYRCDSCDSYVRDNGPEHGGHPADAEPGHSDTCPRYLAALAAWERRHREGE